MPKQSIKKVPADRTSTVPTRSQLHKHLAEELKRVDNLSNACGVLSNENKRLSESLETVVNQRDAMQRQLTECKIQLESSEHEVAQMKLTIDAVTKPLDGINFAPSMSLVGKVAHVANECKKAENLRIDLTAANAECDRRGVEVIRLAAEKTELAHERDRFEKLSADRGAELDNKSDQMVDDCLRLANLLNMPEATEFAVLLPFVIERISEAREACRRLAAAFPSSVMINFKQDDLSGLVGLAAQRISTVTKIKSLVAEAPPEIRDKFKLMTIEEGFGLLLTKLTDANAERIRGVAGSLLFEFREYCEKHPHLRFWQALRNWGCANSILYVTDEGVQLDTFGWLTKVHPSAGKNFARSRALEDLDPAPAAGGRPGSSAEHAPLDADIDNTRADRPMVMEVTALEAAREHWKGGQLSDAIRRLLDHLEEQQRGARSVGESLDEMMLRHERITKMPRQSTEHET